MRGLIEKIASRKLAVTAMVGAATTAGIVDLSWPMAAVVSVYILSQAMVDSRQE